MSWNNYYSRSRSNSIHHSDSYRDVSPPRNSAEQPRDSSMWHTHRDVSPFREEFSGRGRDYFNSSHREPRSESTSRRERYGSRLSQNQSGHAHRPTDYKSYGGGFDPHAGRPQQHHSRPYQQQTHPHQSSSHSDLGRSNAVTRRPEHESIRFGRRPETSTQEYCNQILRDGKKYDTSATLSHRDHRGLSGWENY